MGKFRNLSKAIDGFTTLRNDVKHTDAVFAQRDRLIDMVSLFLPPLPFSFPSVILLCLF